MRILEVHFCDKFLKRYWLCTQPALLVQNICTLSYLLVGSFGMRLFSTLLCLIFQPIYFLHTTMNPAPDGLRLCCALGECFGGEYPD